MWKTTQIKQYKNKIFDSILSSQFVYSALNQKCEWNNQALILQNKKTKKIHYLYLFLTAKKKPYAKKYDIAPKNSSKKIRAVKTKSKAVIWQVDINKQKFYEMLSLMLFQVIPSQSHSEKKILKLQENNLDLIIYFAPLTSRTKSLKSKNSYISDIPLTWRLNWTKSSLFQKIFTLKHLKILNEGFTYKRLENVEQ